MFGRALHLRVFYEPQSLTLPWEFPITWKKSYFWAFCTFTFTTFLQVSTKKPSGFSLVFCPKKGWKVDLRLATFIWMYECLNGMQFFVYYLSTSIYRSFSWGKFSKNHWEIGKLVLHTTVRFFLKNSWWMNQIEGSNHKSNQRIIELYRSSPCVRKWPRQVLFGKVTRFTTSICWHNKMKLDNIHEQSSLHYFNSKGLASLWQYLGNVFIILIKAELL